MVRWTGLGIAMVLTLTACETLPWDRRADSSSSSNEMGVTEPIGPEPGIPISPESRFSDVPLPVGAKEDMERTYVYESRDIQIGRMVYTIRESVAEVAQFYIRECPTSGWKLVNSLQADGAELLFQKTGKRLEVKARNVGMAKGGTLLTLHLTPSEGL